MYIGPQRDVNKQHRLKIIKENKAMLVYVCKKDKSFYKRVRKMKQFNWRKNYKSTHNTLLIRIPGILRANILKFGIKECVFCCALNATNIEVRH